MGSPCHKEPTSQIRRLYLKRFKSYDQCYFFKVGQRSRSRSEVIFFYKWEALVSRNLHAKTKGSISKGSKVMTNVKVVHPTNQQINKPTNRKGKHNMSPLRYRGHKNMLMISRSGDYYVVRFTAFNYIYISCAVTFFKWLQITFPYTLNVLN